MIYYLQGKELETVSELFRNPINDAVVCRDRLSASGELYTVLILHDRDCIRKVLDAMENSPRSAPSPCLLCTAQDQDLLFLFPYREDRRLSTFAPGQITSSAIAEDIAIRLVTECLSSGLPWSLLYLVLEQGLIHLSKDNTVYFTMAVDLTDFRSDRTERNCVSACTRIVLELLSMSRPTRRRKQLKSFDLILKKNAHGAYRTFPELYQDIRLTALPKEKRTLRQRLTGLWNRNRDRLFRLLLVLCILLSVVALAMLVTQILFGDIPWLRLFQNNFDVIGTENLHLGGRV